MLGGGSCCCRVATVAASTCSDGDGVPPSVSAARVAVVAPDKPTTPGRSGVVRAYLRSLPTRVCRAVGAMHACLVPVIEVVLCWSCYVDHTVLALRPCVYILYICVCVVQMMRPQRNTPSFFLLLWGIVRGIIGSYALDLIGYHSLAI